MAAFRNEELGNYKTNLYRGAFDLVGVETGALYSALALRKS